MKDEKKISFRIRDAERLTDMSEATALMALVQAMKDSIRLNHERMERLELILQNNDKAILEANERLIRVASENRRLREENEKLRHRIKNLEGHG